MKDRKKWLGEWFTLNFNGVIRRAKCIDIEFEGGLGPQFFFETKFGNVFRLSRQEIRDHQVWHEY
jgi:hypothetical protein